MPGIPLMIRNQQQLQRVWRALRRALRPVSGTGVCVVAENDDGIVIHVPAPPVAEPPPPMRAKFLAKLGSASSISTNRSEYDWDEYELTGTTFQVKEGGRTSTKYGKALNINEGVNTGSNTEGNGVDVSDSEITFKSWQDAAPIVEMWFVIDVSDDSYRAVFSEPNPITVTCAT